MPNQILNKSNRLAKEKSPYLLQHKNNPVDWYPWGEEALTKAKEENKPLFISIGYSTCHWCHVMNRESFNDEEVAEVLSKYFVPVKVDREERPDIDKVYMTFAKALTGQGGWPLNVLATPEGNPFFIGTYFPKKSNNRITGLIELLTKVHRTWDSDKNSLLEDSEHILKEVRSINKEYNPGLIDENTYKIAKEYLSKIYDKENGGFGSYPKFPMPQYIWYLLKYGEINDDTSALEIAENTLEKMYKGGIFDHIGYGFYRYSVDEKWLVPHFEKMLYDNALMALVLVKAYEITKKELYKEVAEKVFEFIIRDMLCEEGGFYSALDADSEGEEGKYYLFSQKEILELLGEEWGNLYNRYYDITEKGNFKGFNIPNLIGTDLDKISDIDKSTLNSINQMLFTYREKRVKPHRDEKILTSWNGLMIGSLAYGGMILNNDFYLKKAKEAADFIITNSIDKNRILLSTHSDGISYNLGYLEDYSFFIFGMLQLYKSTSDNIYLELSKRLMDNMLGMFGDKDLNGLYFYSHKSEELILRPIEIYDGAIPSGNSFALIDLFILFTITKEEKYMDSYKKILYSFGGEINESPLAHLYSLMVSGNLL